MAEWLASSCHIAHDVASSWGCTSMPDGLLTQKLTLVLTNVAVVF